MCTPCVAAARRCSGRGCSRRSMCSRSAPQQLHVRWLRTARRQPCLGTAHVEHVEHGHATWPLRAVQLQWQPPTRAHAPSLHQERARARAHVPAQRAEEGRPAPRHVEPAHGLARVRRERRAAEPREVAAAGAKRGRRGAAASDTDDDDDDDDELSSEELVPLCGGVEIENRWCRRRGVFRGGGSERGRRGGPGQPLWLEALPAQRLLQEARRHRALALTRSPLRWPAACLLGTAPVVDLGGQRAGRESRDPRKGKIFFIHREN